MIKKIPTYKLSENDKMKAPGFHEIDFSYFLQKRRKMYTENNKIVGGF